MTLSIAHSNEVAALNDDVPSFEDFWLLYPRRVAKKDAHKAWLKLSEAKRIDAIIGLAQWRPVMMQKDAEYLPHPATWINGERWEDELPASAKSLTERVMATPRAPSEPRRPMPQFARDMIAKLRAHSRG